MSSRRGYIYKIYPRRVGTPKIVKNVSMEITPASPSTHPKHSHYKMSKPTTPNEQAQNSKRASSTPQMSLLTTPREQAHNPSGACPQRVVSLGEKITLPAHCSLSKALVCAEAIFSIFTRARIISKTDTKLHLIMCIS